MLDNDVLYYIFDNKSRFDDLESIIYLNKYFFLSFINKYNNDLQYTKLLNTNKLPLFIANLFRNNVVAMRDINELDFKDSFIDVMGSIKNIFAEDMSENIMYSYDQFGNCFLVLKLKMFINNSRSIITPIIIIQKHNLYYRWCIDSAEPYYGLIFNNVINYNDIVILTDLINGREIKYNNCKLWI